MFQSMLLAGVGGFLGTCCRFWVNRFSLLIYNGAFPLGTLAVNLAGCFAIGMLLGWLERGSVLAWDARALLVTGFCGGFTTFSAFADDLWRLAERDQWAAFGAYLLLSLAAGVGALLLGRKICG